MDIPTAPEPKYDLTLLPFALLHVVAIAGGIWVGCTWQDLVALAISYFIGMFAITAGFHRYFAHRAFRTSRWFQFALAFLGTTTVQKGVLWWAGHHRHHHQFSDMEEDIHSPIQRSFLWSHMGWIVSRQYDATPEDKIRDFMKYPELVWLNKHFLIVQIASGVALYLIGGWSLLVWAGIIRTVVLWHGTFTINSLAHLFGRRRYETTDHSRNSFALALLTMGEGWHNNHHHYMHSANQGFFWWEIDMSYYLLKMLSWVGIVWDLKKPPKWALEGKARKHPINPTVNRPARPDRIAA